MSLPDKTKLSELTYGFNGEPFVNVVGNESTTTTLGLSFGLDGVPFVAAEGGGGLPPPKGVDGYIASSIIIM